MRVPLPDAVVLAIYFAKGQNKAIAAQYGVGTATVSQIKKCLRRRSLIQRALAARVRADSAMLATIAAYPSARLVVSSPDLTCSPDTPSGRWLAN